MRFENIYLELDNDDPGQQSAQKIIKEHPDICNIVLPQPKLRDYLKENTIDDLYNLLVNTKSWSKTVDEAAWTMLKSPQFIDIFLKECEVFGLAGEINNKAQIYLENCSRLSKEINGGISSKGQAPTAVGKTTLYKIIGKNFFADDFIILTDRSGKLMLWKERDAWKGKIILTEENHATKATPETEAKDYQMRIAKSEGIITYEVLIQDGEGGFVTRKNELEGPYVFQEATTKMYFKDEDINRDTVHNFDESTAQTAHIINFQKNKYGSYNPKLDRLKQFIIDKHKKIQQILKENIPDAIVIPFVDRIKFPEHLHRARRDFPRLVRYIQVCAQVHQFQREMLTEEEYVKKYSSLIVDSELLLKRTLSTIEPTNDKAFQSLLIENPEGTDSTSSKKRILIVDERDFELIAKYVIPDLAKEYTQLPKVMADRYDLLCSKFGVGEGFRSMEAGEVLGVSDDCVRQILYQLEKKGLCTVNKDSKCYKYQLNAKNVTTSNFGLIKLEEASSLPTTASTINNEPKPLPTLNNIVESPQFRQSQHSTEVSSEPEMEVENIELSDDLLERLKELNATNPDEN
ncbi:MAG: hypothetical protein HY094_00430 [Candidatus Melainabacteria bacterium]|nr:hypothetical protein [Candidatus Melainabacteria bacterium]